MVKSKGFSEIVNGFKICNKYNIVKKIYYLKYQETFIL